MMGKGMLLKHKNLQAIVLCSEKKFQFTKQGEQLYFLKIVVELGHTWKS